MGSKTFRPWSPRQVQLLPPRPDEWLPEKHLVHFVLEVVEELELAEIEEGLRSRDARGEKGYHPRMMTALLLYSYCRGEFSSRRIAAATYEDVATRFLTGDQHPHFTRIAAFRRDHLDALANIFKVTVQLCARAGLVKLGHVSVDGTKIQANASKHKAMSYARMQAEEARLLEQMRALLERAEGTDQQDDERLGVGQGEGSLPDELSRRQSRLNQIRKAKAALEEEAKQSRAEHLRRLAKRNEGRAASDDESVRERACAKTWAARQRADAEELDPGGKDPEDDPTLVPEHRVRTQTDGKPKPRAQRNFTDPDSRIMLNGQGAFMQAYNAQAAVCEGTQVIVACPLSNQPPDNQQLVPVLHEAERVTGRTPDVLTADNGYGSGDNASWCEERGIDAYIAVGTRRRNQSASTAEHSVPDTPKKRMAQKLATPQGDTHYRRRKATVEPVFGQIKEARGCRRFLLRGLHKTRPEWALICATHNLLKLFRHRQTQAA